MGPSFSLRGRLIYIFLTTTSDFFNLLSQSLCTLKLLTSTSFLMSGRLGG
jgi:hypothetical protein